MNHIKSARQRMRIHLCNCSISFINSKSAYFYRTYKLEELRVGEQTKLRPV